MTESGTSTTSEALASFFGRLPAIETITRVITSWAPLTALFTFRGDGEKRVLLDFKSSPARVLFGEEARAGDIYVTIDGPIMHDILLDRLKAGVALGRRELLLRGNALDFSKFIPLFDFGPVLYREHLADVGYDGYAREPGKNLLKETAMSGPAFKGDPIPLVQLSTLEKAVFATLNALSYGMGYFMGILRFRVFRKLSLFDVLSSMSRGLQAAAPRDPAEGPRGA